MIIFYSMPNCGFCMRAKEILKGEIESGIILVESYTKAPEGVNGFPHFVNTSNNLSHTGLPTSSKYLMEKLKYSVEKFISVENLRMGIF